MKSINNYINKNKKDICSKAVQALKKEYPAAVCTLDYKFDYQLLIATRLAAQCTDSRVNIVTKTLFSKYQSLKDFAFAKCEEIEKIIKPCGFFRTKAKDIINISKHLLEKYNAKVPDNMEDLLSLPGVGRKTANLILGDIFKKPAVVVDTHCIRITKRLGLHNSKNAVIIEKILKDLLEKEESNNFCHRLVIHGRKVCKALSPKCDVCCMNSFCKKVF